MKSNQPSFRRSRMRATSLHSDLLPNYSGIGALIATHRNERGAMVTLMRSV